MVAITGLTVFAYFSDIGCDPLASHQVKTGNEVRAISSSVQYLHDAICYHNFTAVLGASHIFID